MQQHISDGFFERVHVKKQQEQNVVHVIIHSGQSIRARVFKSGAYDEVVFLLE